MIEAHGDYVTAKFEWPSRDGEKILAHRKVRAWDDDGYPLVVALSKDGRLVRADSIAGFKDASDREPDRHRFDPDHGRAVASIPGGGWRAVVTHAAGEDMIPVVAWVTHEDGWTGPVFHELGGSYPEPGDDEMQLRLIPPGETP